MSIEDIEYLYKNSVKDNVVIFVDSSKRNKLTYPDPNSYTIDFDEPFKFVYGIEILDASIPRTMYQIDENNNVLKIYINSVIYTITIHPQDLEFDDFIKELNTQIEKKIDDSSLYKIKALSVSSPSSQISKIFFFSYKTIEQNGNIPDPNTDFFILAWDSSMREVLGFDENSNSNHNDYDMITSQEVKEIYCLIETISDDNHTKWQSLISIAKELYWNSLTYNEREITDDKTDYLSNWYNNLSDDEKIRIVIPNYEIIKNGTFKNGTSKGDLGKYNLINNGTKDNPNIDNRNGLQTPGIVTLVGERFITLRSEAIEKHLSTFYSGDNSIGLCLFKLGFSGYVDSRFDFSSVKYKDLHPIGKLSTIDFRFERIDGGLYNFRGLNHHMLISIKYLVPYKKSDQFDYTLNTNYNPDLLEYKKTQYEKDDNSEDEIIELSNNFKKNFLEKEKQYLYSSDEDLDYVDVKNRSNNITDSESSINDSDDSGDSNLKNQNMTPYNKYYK